jgi:hypothetical protein
VIQQTKESESLCHSRTSTSILMPQKDVPPAHWATTIHLEDWPSPKQHPGHQPAFPHHTQTCHRLIGLPQYIQETGQITNNMNLPSESSENELDLLRHGMDDDHDLQEVFIPSAVEDGIDFLAGDFCS